MGGLAREVDPPWRSECIDRLPVPIPCGSVARRVRLQTAGSGAWPISGTTDNPFRMHPMHCHWRTGRVPLPLQSRNRRVPCPGAERWAKPPQYPCCTAAMQRTICAAVASMLGFSWLTSIRNQIQQTLTYVICGDRFMTSSCAILVYIIRAVCCNAQQLPTNAL